jgi:hypothetical protein
MPGWLRAEIEVSGSFTAIIWSVQTVRWELLAPPEIFPIEHRETMQ